MGQFAAWRTLHSWKHAPSNSLDEIEVEEKLLDGSTFSSSEDDFEVQEKAHVSVRGLLRANSAWFYLTVVNLLLFVGALVLQLGSPWRELNTCLRETAYYSPIFDAKSLEFHNVKLNGTLWPPEEMSWSRREPGDPIAEEMWQSFEIVPTFPITRRQVVGLGKDPELVAKFDDDYWDMGEDAYVASLDVQHKMHCLNELRKMTFVNYGDDAPETSTHGQLWWIHLRHCTDMLAQDMLCHADADLVTYNWVDTQLRPFPDFGGNRKCRDVDQLFEYRDAHSVDMDKYFNYRRPHGAKQVPNDPGFYAMFGFVGSDLFPNGQGHPPLPEPTWWGDDISDH